MKIKALVLFNRADPDARQMRGVYILNERDHKSAFNSECDDVHWRSFEAKCLTQWHQNTINTQHEDNSEAIDYVVRMDMPDVRYFWIDPMVAMRLQVRIADPKSWLDVCRLFEVNQEYEVDSLKVAGFHAAWRFTNKPTCLCPNCLNEDAFLLHGRPLVSFGMSMLDGQQQLDAPELLDSFDETEIEKITCGNCDYSADTNSFAFDGEKGDSK